MKNNLIGKEFQSLEDRLITEDLDFLSLLCDTIRGDLEEASSSKLLDQISKINTSAQEEISMSFNHINQLPLIKDIFARHAVNLDQCLTLFIEQNGTAKAKTIQNLNDGITRIREYISILESNINLNAGSSPTNVNLINYIYDDDFVALINSLSSAIKEFFKNTRSCFSELRSSSDSIIDQTLSSKSAISDMFVQLNPSLCVPISGTKSIKGSIGTAATGTALKDKLMKEKLALVSERLDLLNEIKGIMTKNIKIMEKSFTKFYEDARTLFKQMKLTRNQKMDEVHVGDFVTGRSDLIHPNFNNPPPSNPHVNNPARLSPGNIREKILNRWGNARYNSHSPSVRNLPPGTVMPSNLNWGGVTIGNRPPSGMNQSNSNLTIANDKEIKEINEKITGLSRRNEDLLGELTSMKNKMDDIKFENISLRQKLETVVDNRKNSKEPENRNMNELSKSGVNFKPLDNKCEEKRGYGYSTFSENKKNFQLDREGVKNIIIDKGEKNETPTNIKSNSVDTRVKNNLQKSEGSTGMKNLQLNLQKPLVNKTNLNNELNQSTNSNNNESHSHCRPDVAIANLVLQFLNQMANLQENISKKSPNVPELKKFFEVKKQELIKVSEDITRESSLKTIIVTPNKRSIKDTLTGTSSNENSHRIMQNKIPTKPNPKQNIAVSTAKQLPVKNIQCVESATDIVENNPMPTAGHSPTVTKNPISFSGNDHESPGVKAGSYQEEISKLNAIIKSKESELENKIIEISSINEALLNEKEKSDKLEKKIKNEKSIVALIEEKLKEEKLKNKSLEEHRESLFNENIRLANTNLENEKMITCLQDESNNLKIKLTSENDKILKEKQGNIAQLKKEIEELKLELTQANTNNDNLIQENQKLQNMGNQRKKEIEVHAESLTEENLKLKQEVSLSVKELEEKKMEITQKKKELENLKKINDELNVLVAKGNDEISKQIDENKELRAQIREKEKQIDIIQNEITNLTKQIEDSKKESASLQKQNEERKNERNNEIRDLKTALNDKDKQIEMIQINNNAEMNREIVKLKNQIHLVTCELSERQADIEKINAEKSKLSAVIKEQLEANDKIKIKNEELLQEIIQRKQEISKFSNDNELLKTKFEKEKLKCESLTLDLINTQKEIDYIEKENLKISQVFGIKQEENKNLNTTLESTKKKLNENAETIQKLKDDIQNINSLFQKANAQIDSIKQENDELFLQFSEKQKDLDLITSQNEQLNSKLLQSHKEIESINNSNKESNTLLSQRQLTIDQLQKEKEQLNEDFRKMRKELEKFNKINEELNSLVHKSNDEIAKLLVANEELNEQLIEKDKLVSKDASLSVQLQDKIKQIEDLHHDLNEIQSEKVKLKNELNEKESSLNSKDNLNSTLMKNIQELNNQIQVQQNQITTLKTYQNTLETQNTQFQKDIKNIQQEITELEIIKERQIKELTDLRKEKQAEVDKHVNEISHMSVQVQDLQRESNALQKENDSKQKEIIILNQKIEAIQKENENLTEENATRISSLKKTIKELNDSYTLEKNEKEKLKHDFENMNVSNNKDFVVRLSQKDEQMRLFTEKFNEIKKSMDEVKDSKANMEKLLAESEEKLLAIETEKSSLMKENKDLKNRIAQIKIEFSELSKDKESELARLIESNSILTKEKESMIKTIHGTILLKLTSILNSVVSDHRNKIAILPNKNFSEEQESPSGLIFDNLLNEITSTVEMINKKLTEYYTRCMENEDERKMLEQKLIDINLFSDQKIRDFQVRNKQLEEVQEEYCRKIQEVVKEKAPHLITENLKSSSDEYMKALDLFRLYNAELAKINSLMEDKLNKALTKARKYKEMYKSQTAQPMMNAQSVVNPNNFTNSNINITVPSSLYIPEKYKIISDKQLNNLKWILLTFKDIKENELTYQNTYWVNSTDIKPSLFNQYMSENDCKKEIEDLLAIQSDLLEKISKAQEDLSKCKHEKEKLQRQVLTINSTSNQSNNLSMNANTQKTISPSIDLNLNIKPSLTTIPLDKYEKLLIFLNEEQDKNKKASAIIDQLKSENEYLRVIVEQNKSKIEKVGEGLGLSIINDNGSKFLDEELNINDIFIDGEIGEKRNLSNKEVEKNKSQTNADSPKKEQETETVSGKEKELPIVNQQPDVIQQKDEQGESISGTERRNSKESTKTAGKRIDTPGTVKNSYRETVKKMDEDAKLFTEQLKSIKTELRLTIEERDQFKRKYDDAISINLGKKPEVINLLKQTFEKLVNEIIISGKVKEYAVIILKLLDYTEEDISRIIYRKDKKGGFMGLFGKK